jgi:cold shock CspA family protein
MAGNRWRSRNHRAVGTPVFGPPAAPHEGLINERGFAPGRGFCFVTDEKSRESLFIHIGDCAESVFYQLQPGARIAFEVFSGRDGKVRAHRVKLLD